MSESSRAALERAVVVLLRPLIRLLLKRGMAYGRFAELAKRVYVETAQRDFAVPTRKLSISRVAVLTGLTRKEASRLMQPETQMESEVDEGAARRQVNRAARVVSAWVQDPVYHDGRGAPVSLVFEDDEAGGGRPSFSGLVTTHGGDVGPRAVLDELLRVGAVDRLRDGRIRLRERAYIPAVDEAAKLDILGTDVADLVSTLEHNLDPDAGSPFFQRKVAYDNLPPSYLPALRELLARRGQSLLEELDVDMARHDRDVEADVRGDGRSRAMIGIYYYEEPHDDEEA